MSRKISDFFQPTSRLAGSKKSSSEELSSNPRKILNCRVVLSDIGQQLSKNQPQIHKNVKIEPEEEYLTILESNIIKGEPDVYHVSKKIKIEEEKVAKSLKNSQNSLKPKRKRNKRTKNLPNNEIIITTIPRQELPPQLQNSSQPRIITCKFCKIQSTNYNAHTKHIQKFHPEKLFTCDLCSSKCSTLIGMRSHMTNKHLNKRNQPFICDYCGKEWKSKARLYYHVLAHRPRIECEICHIKIKHESMQEHLRDFHVDDRKFNCTMCTKNFKADKDLRRHEKVHLKKFNCQICFRKFRLQYDLNVHFNQTHENPGSFKCDICGMKFNEKVVLKRHEYRHNNKEKNLKCDRCDYASADKQLYKRHLDAHKRKDERDAKLKNPKKCKICNNLYKNETSLSTHLKYSHTGVTYECDYCSKVIKTKKVFEKHIEKHIRKL